MEYSGRDRCGKTTMAVGDLFRLLETLRYSPGESWGNCFIGLEDYHYVDNERLLFELEKTLMEHRQHLIYFIDDATQFFPARGYGNKRQSNVLAHIWQIQKQFCYIFYTDHVGKTVDLILDEATHYTLLPKYSQVEDCIRYQVLFRRDVLIQKGIIERVSLIQKRFDSWRPTGIIIKRGSNYNE